MLNNSRALSVFKQATVVILSLSSQPIWAEENSNENERRPSSLRTAEEGHLNKTTQAHPAIPRSVISPTESNESTGTRDALPKTRIFPVRLTAGSLKGTVVKLTGNFGPTRGEKSNNRVTTPLPSQVYIFTGKLKALGVDGISTPPKAGQTPQPFKIIDTDEEGKFEIILPPGIYTVLPTVDGKFIKNSFDGLGFYSTTEVKSGMQTIEQLRDTRDAIGVN